MYEQFNPKNYKGNLTMTELPLGGVWAEPGSSVMRKTGDWKTERPIHSKEKCVNCLTCWAYCPDSCILVKDNKIEGYDYDHCKGCGICAAVCPPKVCAITMEKSR
jgi:pyruvate ferredoxin oxidoreductase delta subunit